MCYNAFMNPDEEKTIKRLTQAVEQAYNSPSKMFWRGLLWGLGRGIGSLIGWLLLLAILIYLIRLTGLDETFKNLLDLLGKISNSVNSLRR